MNTLLQKIEDQITELNNKKKVIEKYFDISEYTDRWGTKRLSTSAINKEVDCVMIKHNCGCCPDSPLEVWPYKLIDEIEIYSKPAYFFVGEQNAYGYGDKPNNDWQKELRDAEIPEFIIEKIQEYFDDNPPKEYEDDCDLDDNTYFKGRE